MGMTVAELKEKYTNEFSGFVNIDGLDVHYRDEGEGDVILLIHGTFASLHAFDEWTEILKKSYRVVRLDLPGFGITGPHPKHAYNIDRYTDFLKLFLEELDVSECYIAGNSLGGWLVWEFGLKFPEKVKKMILIDAAGYINDRNFPLPFVIAQTPVLRNVFNYVPKAVVRRFVRQVFTDQSKVTEEVVTRYFDLFHREGNKEAFVKIANSYFEQNTHNLHQLKMPVLIMWGEKDNWLNVEHAYKFAKDLPNAELLIYKDVGHIPMEEIPMQTVKDIKAFIKKK